MIAVFFWMSVYDEDFLFHLIKIFRNNLLHGFTEVGDFSSLFFH